MCRSLHLALLNVTRFAQAHLSKPVKVPLGGIPKTVKYSNETLLEELFILVATKEQKKSSSSVVTFINFFYQLNLNIIIFSVFFLYC